MEKINAGQFWGRYKKLAAKDFPVVTKTHISHSTLSTWKNKKIFPRADKAYQIADAINTTVEYLITGKETDNSTCSKDAMEIAKTADKLNIEGITLLKIVAKTLSDFNFLKEK